jgi:hypothetical protein
MKFRELEDGKEEVERMIKDRENKIQLWWLEKIPFVAVGFLAGLITASQFVSCMGAHYKP